METYDVVFKSANNETNNYRTCQSLFDFLKISLSPVKKNSVRKLNKK